MKGTQQMEKRMMNKLCEEAAWIVSRFCIFFVLQFLPENGVEDWV